ncbi:MAG: chemotaxis protein CheW [Deltaproteobacteria bacterium]|nr:chemotaxis protein CheW [Deltaproteobacteria bacterium]MBW2359816.1 chemotaxis protein CheW [Deltaproteobacteria bacterium]
MSAPAAVAAEERLLTFEVAGSLYALPIACVVEVAEASALACIPMLPLELAGVLNFHGDALPVMRRETLLDLDAQELPEPSHVLVLAPRPNGGAKLGLCADRIEGLVVGDGARSVGAGPVAERRSIDGRLVFVLDAERLVARAAEAIEASLEWSE